MSGQSVLTIDDVHRAFPGQPRGAHIEQVVRLASLIEDHDGRFNGRLKCAAIYHDIGYAESWKRTGFHPVDGALAARHHGLDDEIVDAILHHGGAWLETQLSHPALTADYGPHCRLMETDLSRALNYADLHSGPQGQFFSLDERLVDIRQRHASNTALLKVLDAYDDRFRSIEHEWQSIAFPSHALPKETLSL